MTLLPERLVIPGILYGDSRFSVNNKIAFFIIGAPKAATTSLKTYIAGHEDFVANEGREMTYFVNDEEYSRGETELWRTYYSKHDLNGKVLIAKNVSVMYSEKALLRLKAHNPSVKLVMVLRNPVDRAYSAYWFARRRGWEDIEDFEEAAFANPDRFKGDWIREGGCAYIEQGVYEKYIKLVHRIFGENSLKVFLLEDLKSAPQEVCDELSDWMGVSRFKIEAAPKKYNQAATARSRLVLNIEQQKTTRLKKLVKLIFSRRQRNYIKKIISRLNEKPFEVPPITESVKTRLKTLYSPANRELENILRRSIPW